MTRPSVVRAAADVVSSIKVAPNVEIVVLSGIVRLLTPVRDVSSESMSAPAAVTLAVSVTSANASTPANLVSCALVNEAVVASNTA